MMKERPNAWNLLRALAFAALATALVLPAQAADSVYTVGNYPIQAQADNAVAAKEKALAEGQQAAFRSLLKRLVPVTAYARGKRLDSVKAADLIEGVRVRAERNSSTEYIASFDFSFNAKSVRDLLRREGIPFTDDQAPKVTLVPVWRSAAAQPPREEAAWTNVWKGLDLENSLTPIKLQPLSKSIRPRRSMRSPPAMEARCARSPPSTTPSTCWWLWRSPTRRQGGSVSRSRAPMRWVRSRSNVLTGSMRAIPATPANLRPLSVCAFSRAGGRPSKCGAGLGRRRRAEEAEAEIRIC